MRLIQENIQIELRTDNEDIEGALKDFVLLFRYKESVKVYISESVNIYENVDNFVNN